MSSKTKVISILRGGIGNQLFCYAAARRLALANDAELVIDHVTGFTRDFKYRRVFALDRFHIAGRTATYRERLEPLGGIRRKFRKLVSASQPFYQRGYLEQEGLDFDQRLLDYRVSGTVYLDGLWQSEEYFKDVAAVIRRDLRMIPPQDATNTSMANHIRSVKAVCVHVRWFDHPSCSGTSDYNLPPGYYARAIRWVSARVENPHFFLFSDDPDAARIMGWIPNNRVTYVAHNCGDENAHADLWLMTLCKHFIIANSTFSWWGAWLSASKSRIVVTPAVTSYQGTCGWGFKGLIPSGWTIL